MKAESKNRLTICIILAKAFSGRKGSCASMETARTDHRHYLEIPI